MTIGSGKSRAIEQLIEGQRRGGIADHRGGVEGAAARGFDSRIEKVEASFVEELREVLVVTSEGRWASDVLPLVRFSVRAVAEDGTKRQAGSSGGGGRRGMDYFARPNCDPQWHGREAARVALAMLDAREAPAGEMEVVLCPADSYGARYVCPAEDDVCFSGSDAGKDGLYNARSADIFVFEVPGGTCTLLGNQ